MMMKFGDGRQHDGDIATIGFRDATYRDLALISALRGRNVLIPSLSRRASVHCFRLVGPATMASLSSTHQCCRGGLALRAKNVKVSRLQIQLHQRGIPCLPSFSNTSNTVTARLAT